jgi:hypothetical protein
MYTYHLFIISNGDYLAVFFSIILQASIQMLAAEKVSASLHVGQIFVHG